MDRVRVRATADSRVATSRSGTATGKVRRANAVDARAKAVMGDPVKAADQSAGDK
jgi:hypothetical protein